MNYLYLLLAVASLGCLGILHKVADHRRCRPAAINLLLFACAALLSSAFCVFHLRRASVSAPGFALAVALICGAFASLAVLSFQHGVRYGMISTSWLIIQLSTTIPTVLSIVIYRERVSPKRAVSVALAIIALLLLWVDRRRQERQAGTPAAAAQPMAAREVG